jgi:glutamine amidotransferase
MSIAVVDYGTGNLRSVAKALVHVAPGADVIVSSDPAVIRAASHVVLPGQSAMPDTIASLDGSGLRGVVLECLRDRPFLGVCLGLQMLFEATEEGPTRGLGVLAGRVEKFREEAMALPSGERLKVPHMGWSPRPPDADARAVDRHRRRRAILFCAQLLPGTGGSGADGGHGRVSGAVLLAP